MNVSKAEILESLFLFHDNGKEKKRKEGHITRRSVGEDQSQPKLGCSCCSTSLLGKVVLVRCQSSKAVEHLDIHCFQNKNGFGLVCFVSTQSFPYSSVAPGSYHGHSKLRSVFEKESREKNTYRDFGAAFDSSLWQEDIKVHSAQRRSG